MDILYFKEHTSLLPRSGLVFVPPEALMYRAVLLACMALKTDTQTLKLLLAPGRRTVCELIHGFTLSLYQTSDVLIMMKTNSNNRSNNKNSRPYCNNNNTTSNTTIKHTNTTSVTGNTITTTTTTITLLPPHHHTVHKQQLQGSIKRLIKPLQF